MIIYKGKLFIISLGREVNMFQIIFWACAVIILLGIELATFQLVSIWFAGSSLVCLICAACHMPESFMGQVVIFVIISCLLLIATKPLVKKLKATKSVPTNADLDIGKTATVIEAVDANNGRVRLNGVDWSARTADGKKLKVGTNCTVEKIEGSKFIVK